MDMYKSPMLLLMAIACGWNEDQSTSVVTAPPFASIFRIRPSVNSATYMLPRQSITTDLISLNVEVEAVDVLLPPAVAVPAYVVTLLNVRAGTFAAEGIRLLMALLL